MLAVTQRRFGGSDVLELTQIEPPRPLPTEIVVRVRAVSVNPVEPFIRSGAFPLLGDPPFVLGWDVCGVVEQVVPGTERFAVGDEVYGMPFFPRQAAGNAELVAAPSRMFSRKPANLDHIHAAALPLVALTAYQGLVEYAKVAPGMKVLVHGAGGGVGHIAVQLAKIHGAEVIATAGADKHDFVHGLGADRILDYRSVDFTDEVRDADIVFDVIGGEYGLRSLRSLRPGGVLVTAVDRSDAELAAATREAGHRFCGVAVEPDTAVLDRITELVEAGRLSPRVAQTFPLADIAKAHDLIEHGHTAGKVVLTMP